jgi:hypothetical protein
VTQAAAVGTGDIDQLHMIPAAVANRFRAKLNLKPFDLNDLSIHRITCMPEMQDLPPSRQRQQQPKTKKPPISRRL